MMRAVIAEVRDPETGKILLRRSVGEDLLERYIMLKKQGDMGTNNLGRFLQALFTPKAKGATLAVTLYDTSNTARSISITNYHTYSMFNNTNYADLPVRIKCGTSNTPPSKTDYNLKGTIIGDTLASASWTDGRDSVDVVASFSWTEDKTVYEMGLFMTMCYSTASPYTCEIMLDRTVFPDGITVPAGKTLILIYRIVI